MIASLFITVVMIIGLFLIFKIKPSDMGKSTGKKRRLSFKEAHENALGIQKHNFIERQFVRAKYTLKMIDREKQYGLFKRACVVLAVVCALIGFMFGNPILAIVLAFAGMSVPILVIQVTASKFQRRANNEVFTALSMITSSYFISENIVDAVKENINVIKPPLDGVFRTFLSHTEKIDPSVSKAVSAIRPLVNSEIWREWCDAMQLCIEDPSKKYVLSEIVKKSTEMDRVQDELMVKLENPMSETIVLYIFTIANVPLVCSFYQDWTGVLEHTLQGWAAIACIAAAGVFAAYKCVRAMRPLDYDFSKEAR